MPLETKAELGQWNIECSRCCGIFKQRDIERNPNNGLLVCYRCQEPYNIALNYKYPVFDDFKPVFPIQKIQPDITEADLYVEEE